MPQIILVGDILQIDSLFSLKGITLCVPLQRHVLLHFLQIKRKSATLMIFADIMKFERVLQEMEK